MHRVHQDEAGREQRLLDLDEIARAGARRMLAEALEAEVQDYLNAARGERDEQGHALVVRNGHANEREILLGAGSVKVNAPRVNDTRFDNTSTLSGEALGGGAHAGLAFEVPGDSGAIREKSRQLSGVDQGCLYLAVVPASAPFIPFEIVS